MLTYALFDLLHLDGVDVADAPLLERKALLQSSCWKGRAARWRSVPMCRAMATRPIAWPVSSISKASFPSAPTAATTAAAVMTGARPNSWPATSLRWWATPHLRAAVPAFGALLLARPDAEHGWLYAGRVGPVFGRADRRDQQAHQGRWRKPTAYVPTQDTDPRAATWFEPRFVVEVFYRGIGGQKLLRQASLKAVRADKDIADLADSDRAGTALAARTPAPRDLRARPGWHRWRIARRHRCPPGKILFPGDGYTKQDVELLHGSDGAPASRGD